MSCPPTLDPAALTGGWLTVNLMLAGLLTHHAGRLDLGPNVNSTLAERLLVRRLPLAVDER